MTLARTALALIALAAATPDARFDAQSGYRIADYRGVVPAPPPATARRRSRRALI